MAQIIIFHARPWKMIDQATGHPRSGVSVSYVNTGTLAPKSKEDGSEFGFSPAKESIPVEDLAKLKAVPGLYNVDFEFRATNGQNKAYISNLQFVSEIKIDAAGKK